MNRASTAARDLAAMRRRVTKACAECGMVVEGTARRRYCSSRCALRASRGRRRGDVPPLVAYLDAIREEITGGRVADDRTADIVREARDARADEL